MSARESSPSHDLDDTVDTAVHERIVDAHPEHDERDVHRERGPRRTDAARARILHRRRQTLIGLAAFSVLMLTIALFVGTWTWVLAAASGVALAAYVVHLRNETRREEERRLTREIRANRARSGSRERSDTRSQSSLAANAFVASGVVEADVVMIDDEDLAFYDVADSPVADSVNLTGRRSHSEYQDSPDYYDWDDEYDDAAYGVNGATPVRADDDEIRPAV